MLLQCYSAMRYWHAVFAFAVAMAVSALLTPVVARIARRFGAVAGLRDRGLSRQETPVLGGIAILAGVLLAAAIWVPDTRLTHLEAILAGACAITLIGAVDDVVELKPVAEADRSDWSGRDRSGGGREATSIVLPFAGQLALPSFPAARGPRSLSVIFLVAVMNVVNFSDGIDGLAAGLCAIDGIAFSIIAFDLPGPTALAVVRGDLAALTAGASLGFLFHNFHPASVFMGDSGANLLGYLLGVAAVVGLAEDERGRRPGRAAGDPRGPVPRHRVRGRQAREVRAQAVVGRRQPLPPSDGADRIQPAQDGRIPVRVDADARGRRDRAAVRPVSRPPSPHHYHLGWLIVMVAIGVIAIAASVYLVYVLEILKFRSFRARELRTTDPDTSEHEIDERVQARVRDGRVRASQRWARVVAEPRDARAEPAHRTGARCPRRGRGCHRGGGRCSIRARRLRCACVRARDGRAGGSGVDRVVRDRADRPTLRRGDHRGAAVDARQPPRVLRRDLRAERGPADRRADRDHRLDPGQRAAGPRTGDRRRRRCVRATA